MNAVFRVFHPQSGYSTIPLLLCWGLLVYLTGTLAGVLFAGFVAVVLIGALKALFRRIKKSHYLLLSINENIHTITYAVTAALLTLVLASYLIPKEVFLDIYTLQIILIAPTMLVLTFLVHYLHHCFLDTPPRALSSLGIAVLKTFFFLLVVIGSLAFATQNAMNITFSQQEHLMQSLTLPSEELRTSDLIVIQELVIQWDAAYARATTPRLDCYLCKPSLFLTNTVKRVEGLLSVQYATQLADGLSYELTDIHNTPTNILEEQLFAFEHIVDEHPEVFAAPPSVLGENPSMQDLWEHFGKNATLPPPADIAVGLVFDDAPLHHALEHSLQHTLLYTQGLRQADKILSLDIALRPPLIIALYDNRNTDETLDSKFIRYSILAAYVEQKQNTPKLVR